MASLVPQLWYRPWASAFEDGNGLMGPSFTDDVCNCELIMMVGLPASGKTDHPEKRYVLLGTDLALDQMKVLLIGGSTGTMLEALQVDGDTHDIHGFKANNGYVAPYDGEESSSSGNRLKMRLKEFHRSAASFRALDRNYLTPFFTTQAGDRDDNDDSHETMADGSSTTNNVSNGTQFPVSFTMTIDERQANRNQLFEELMCEMNDEIKLLEQHMNELKLHIQRIRVLKDVADDLYCK